METNLVNIANIKAMIKENSRYEMTEVIDNMIRYFRHLESEKKGNENRNWRN